MYLTILASADIGVCKSSYVDIVINNKPEAVIVIPDKTTDQIRLAAKDLSSYIHMSTGAQIPIIHESDIDNYKNKVKIWVGQTQYVVNSKVGTRNLSGDGFIIDFPDRCNMLIAGSTDWGIEFGVYEFLERYVGVRWLLPGPNGDYIPKHNSIRIKKITVKQEPSFFSRLLSGLRGAPQATWARRNRMHGQIKFHHNLLNLFPPSKYADVHPEFYPILRGKRFIPKEGVAGWQPCFSAQGIVDEAVKNICDYFSKHPEESSYSLGVNDSGGHCECDICRVKNGGVKNFLGLRNMSDLYFEWANAVVEGVLKKYPDKWFGCLAYSEVAAPPSKIKVHPRIVPFMTYDRMKWVAPSYEAEGKKLTEQWHRQSPVLGWYDYIYGTPYLVPRVYFHKMADYYRHGYAQGVRAMYAEAYPNWGEGPKLYVALKLQWNLNLDVDKLLGEWYEKCVGKEAAPYLKAYYDLWENFWTKKVPKSKWFSAGGQYLWFHEAGYIDVMDDEIFKSRYLLEKAVAVTKTSDQKKRADLILKAFEYYEASVISYKDKDKCSGVSAFQFGHDCDQYRKMKDKRLSLINEFQDDPVLIHPRRFDQFKSLGY